VDVFVMVSIIVSFAALVTAHVSLSAGLAARDPWWRGALAFVVPPLAPFWGVKEKLRARTIAWVAAVAAYAAARVAAWVIAR
jgi:hypothetical protein